MSILTTDNRTLDIEEILSLLPHRYPFLLVDRVLDFDKGKFLRAVKNVSFNEPFFQGHFPQEPVMPGVLQVEAMAQVYKLLAAQVITKDGDNYFDTVRPEVVLGSSIEGVMAFLAAPENVEYKAQLFTAYKASVIN